jgi:Pseudouridylate synthases, 23S RNA-specific
MRKTITIKIMANESGLPVKTVLSKREGLSRREISRLKFSNGILLNGKTCRVTQPVHSEDVLEIIFPEIDGIRLGYLPEKPDILYEDEDVVLVNKPAGMFLPQFFVMKKSMIWFNDDLIIRKAEYDIAIHGCCRMIFIMKLMRLDILIHTTPSHQNKNRSIATQHVYYRLKNFVCTDCYSDLYRVY